MVKHTKIKLLKIIVLLFRMQITCQLWLQKDDAYKKCKVQPQK